MVLTGCSSGSSELKVIPSDRVTVEKTNDELIAYFHSTDVTDFSSSSFAVEVNGKYEDYIIIQGKGSEKDDKRVKDDETKSEVLWSKEFDIPVYSRVYYYEGNTEDFMQAADSSQLLDDCILLYQK